MENLDELIVEIDNIKQSGIIHITQIDECHVVGVTRGKRIYQKNESKAKLMLSVYDEKDALRDIAERLNEALFCTSFTEEKLDVLREKVEKIIKRCIEIGYQNIGLRFIALLGQGKLATKSAPQVQLDKKVKDYLLKTVRGYRCAQ